MVDTFGQPIGAYADITEVVSAAAQTEILAEIDKFLALIPDITADPPVVAATPDFDQIPPHTAQKLRTELASLKAAIDAAPTA